MTLDPDTAQIVRRRMQERGQSFTEAVNELIRSGAARAGVHFQTPTAAMGRPQVNFDQALQLAAEVEDDELIRRSPPSA